MFSRIGREIQRWIDRLPWRRKPSKPTPPPVDEIRPPEPPQDAPEPHPPLQPAPDPAIRWFERNGRAILQIRADYAARGRGIITAHGHKHLVPATQTHDDWIQAVTRTPPERRIDGYDEWTLPHSMADIAARARQLGPGSGSIVMVFAKGARDVAYFIFADRMYPPNVPVQNVTNQEWRGMR